MLWQAPVAIGGAVTGRDDQVAERFRTMMDRRHFVDHEPGVLLIWIPVEREGLAELIPQVEARHPGARFAVRRTGSATAVQVTAREEVLATITKLYIEAGR
jgi:hypothetical protein